VTGGAWLVAGGWWLVVGGGLLASVAVYITASLLLGSEELRLVVGLITRRLPGRIGR
jgi:hypothetical protein